MTSTLTITRPDDWHLHVRDGAALQTVVPHTAAQFGRAIIMPNLKPPVTTAELAMAYKARIMAAVPKGVAAARAKVTGSASGASAPSVSAPPKFKTNLKPKPKQGPTPKGRAAKAARPGVKPKRATRSPSTPQRKR